jgi:hypothetical protein
MWAMSAPIFRAPMRDDARLALRHGLVRIREVPGEKGERMVRRFAATFARGGRNFQRTHDAAAERRTEELWKSRARSA